MKTAGRRSLVTVLVLVLVLVYAYAGGSSHSAHYGKAVLQNATGNGTVYLSTAAASNSGQSGTTTGSDGTTASAGATSYITWNCGGNSSNDSKTYYARSSSSAQGYYFAGWATSATATSYTASSTGQKFSASSTNSSSPTTTTIYGFFKPVTVTGVNPANINVTATSSTATYPENENDKTITFTVANSKALTDFTYTPNGKSGLFNVSNWVWVNASTVTCDYTFAGTGTFGGESRTYEQEVTLTSKGDANSTKTCKITYKFHDVVVNSGAADEFTAAYKSTDASQTAVTKTAVFSVDYVDALSNFDEPTFTDVTGGGTWTYSNMAFDKNNNTITVTFTFNGNLLAGNHSAKLTLKAKDAIGGTTADGKKTITINATNELEPEYDVEVYDAGGTLLSDNTTLWAEGLALANANDGSTIKLVRDITLDIATLKKWQDFTNNITLDLNGKTLKTTTLNATYYAFLRVNAADKTLTIIDSKSGGTVYVEGTRDNRLTAVEVTKGNLILGKGQIEIKNNNTSTGTADRLYSNAIYVSAGQSFTMNGGQLTARRGARDAYGLYVAADATNRAVATINDGTIYSYATTYSYGIRGYGDININGGTIHSETLTSTYAFGVYVQAASNATAANGYYGVLTMKGGTIEAVTKTTTAYGIYAQATATATTTAPDGTLTNRSAGKVSITGGTIKALPTTTTAYGVYVAGDYNSKDNTHVTTTIKNATIISTGTTTTHGVYSAASISNGGCLQGDVELTNTTIESTTTTGGSAYCVFAQAAAATVYSGTQMGEYANGAQVVINSGTYTADAKTSGAYTVGSTTRTINNFAPDYTRGGNVMGYPVVMIHDGTFNAYARATAATAEARAVTTGGYTTILGGTFNAESYGRYVRCIWGEAGRMLINNATINAVSHGSHNGATSGVGDVYGVYLNAAVAAYTGFAYRCEAEINNCNISAISEVGSGAYGIYAQCASRTFNPLTLRADSTAAKWSATAFEQYKGIYLDNGVSVAGKCSVTGGKITVSANTSTAYGAYMNGTTISACGRTSASPELNMKNVTVDVKAGTSTACAVRSGGPTEINNCTFTSNAGTTTAYGVFNNDKKTTISNSTINVTAGTGSAFGFYGQIGITPNAVTNQNIAGTTTTTIPANSHPGITQGEFELNDGNEVTVKTTSGNTSYGIFLNAIKKNIASGPAVGDYAVGAMAVINGGKYTATAAGTTAYAICMTATQTQGEVTGAATCTVNGGKFKGTATSTYADVNASADTENLVLAGGYYVTKTNLEKYIKDPYSLLPLTSGSVYNEGYRYEVGTGNSGAIVCKVYSGTTLTKSYQTVEEALQFVNQNSGTAYTIVIVEDCKLSAGDYVLPAKATLLVPYNASQTSAIGTTANRTNTSPAGRTAYKKLTFAESANLTCLGTIEVSAQQYSGGGSNTGCVQGAYGQIIMKKGSHIDLESGAKIQAWGYITGDGTITAKNGSYSREMFVIGDWKGGAQAYAMNDNTKKVFPVTHYYYQNIECPIRYMAGAVAYGAATIYASSSIYKVDDIHFIGTGSDYMFIMSTASASDDQWVEKAYNPAKDSITYTLNSGAALNSLTLTLMSYKFTSSSYVLPICSNMNIVMHEGTTTINYNTYFMPGSKLIIDKLGTCSIKNNLYFYDLDDFTTTYNGSSTIYRIGFSPSWAVTTTNPRSTTAVDAEMFVHGEVKVAGQLYTTTGGANIHSTVEDAGKITYSATASTSTTTISQHTAGSGSGFSGVATYTDHSCTAAKLKDEDGTYHATAGTTSSQQWVYMNYDSGDGRGEVPQWVKVSNNNDCFMTLNSDQYAHPSDYVKVVANSPNDYAYHDAATSARYFIYTNAATSSSSCIWWEGEPVTVSGTKYYVANQEQFDNYGTYYYYDSSAGYWKPKTVTITWNINGTATNYSINYGTIPYWLGANPTKTSSSSNYYYSWTGWDSSSSNTGSAEYGKERGDLPVATTNATYYAHFDQTYYQYTITFKNADGSILDAPLVNAGEMPVCGVTPTQPSTAQYEYTFSGWSPSLSAVTASATYTAQYTQKTRSYIVNFFDYDAKTVLQDKEFSYGTAPKFEGETPTREATSAYSYSFTGWTNQTTGTFYASGATLPNVTGAVNYIANYEQVEKKYKVTFKSEDGSTTLWSKEYTYEATPSYGGSTPTKAEDDEYTYSFDGWSATVGGDKIATLPSVTVDVTYYAHFAKTPKSFTVTWRNYDNSLLETDVDVEFGTTPSYDGETPQKAADAQYTYTHDGWSATAGGEKLTSLPAVSGNVTYYAHFSGTLNKYTITWKSEDGGTTLKTDENIEYGTNPTYSGTTPTKTADTQYTYTHDGWSATAGGEKLATLPTVGGNATYYAHFNGTLNKYTVTWQNEDGTILETDENVEYGTTPSYDGETPAKEPTAALTYTFKEWSPAISAVTGNIIYTATYTEATRTYIVTWQNENGTELEKDENVPYGATPSYDGSTPTKDPTAEFTYTFASWTPSVSEVTEDVTYTATFTPTTRSYSVVFVDEDGVTILLDPTSYNYGTTPTAPANPTKAATAQYSYTFSGWSPAIGTVTGNQTYTATYTATVNTYTVTWRNEDGTVLKTDTDVPYGTTPAYSGETPTKAADAQYTYTFDKWSPDIAQVTGNAEYTATYTNTLNTYTVTWKNEDGTVLKTDLEVPYGTIPAYSGETPAKASTATHYYTFKGWNPAIEEVKGNQIYTAEFDEHEIVDVTITTVAEGNHGTITGGGSYTPGSTAVLRVTAEDCYKFTGWTDGNTDNPRSVEVTGNATYTAQFKFLSFTVKVETENTEKGTVEVE